MLHDKHSQGVTTMYYDRELKSIVYIHVYYSPTVISICTPLRFVREGKSSRARAPESEAQYTGVKGADQTVR